MTLVQKIREECKPDDRSYMTDDVSAFYERCPLFKLLAMICPRPMWYIGHVLMCTYHCRKWNNRTLSQKRENDYRQNAMLHSGRCILVHATKKRTPHTWLHLKMFGRAQVTEIVSQYSILLNKKPHHVKYICPFLALDITYHLNKWLNDYNKFN